MSLLMILMLVAVMLSCMVALYCYKKNIVRWLPSYFRHQLSLLCLSSTSSPATVTDICFLCVDHFELNGNPDRLADWVENYPKLARKHIDADGCHPKHTFFYALDLLHPHELVALKPMMDAGFGEIELHWHHDNDDQESFKRKLTAGLAIFQEHGFMLPFESGQQACFSFIHGNWSLDNACGPSVCGVNGEITLLREAGCYGDFTFPALFNGAQPPMVNNIYYCQDSGVGKSHFSGRNAVVGQKPLNEEFMVMQGPMSINFKDWRHVWHPTFEDGDLGAANTHGDPKRIDEWVRQRIHVKGRPNWAFVKTFCHGAQDRKAVLGEQTDQMFSHLEKTYNDGSRYRLHYVSAREAYNIIRAAEDGKDGNPNDYRDYIIPPPDQRLSAPIKPASGA